MMLNRGLQASDGIKSCLLGNQMGVWCLSRKALAISKRCPLGFPPKPRGGEGRQLLWAWAPPACQAVCWQLAPVGNQQQSEANC